CGQLPAAARRRRNIGSPECTRTCWSYPMKWITRERVKVDRVACPWLIKKFVDQHAEFVFVPPDKVMEEAKRLGATPYDVKGRRAGSPRKGVLVRGDPEKITTSRRTQRSCCLERSSTARIPTTRSIISRKDQGSKRSPKDFAISDTRTITPSMPRNGSSTTPFTPTAKRWPARASRTAIWSSDN